jgi:hypothetical protein
LFLCGVFGRRRPLQTQNVVGYESYVWRSAVSGRWTSSAWSECKNTGYITYSASSAECTFKQFRTVQCVNTVSGSIASSESECVAADKPSIEQFCQGACPSTKTCEELGTNFSVRDALLQASRIWENNPDVADMTNTTAAFRLCVRVALRFLTRPRTKLGRASRTTLWRLGAIRRLARKASLVTVIIPKTELLNIMITGRAL